MTFFNRFISTFTIFGILSIALFACRGKLADSNREFTSIKKNASDLHRTEISPVFDCPLNSQRNIVWCASFLIAWKSLCEFSGGEVQIENAPAIVQSLNKSKVSKEDVPEGCYLAEAGLASKEFLARIERNMTERFSIEKRESLIANIPPNPHAWLIYSYLSRNLLFQYPFERSDRGLNFGGTMVEAFGIERYSKSKGNQRRAAQQVLIYFQTSDLCIVELLTQQEEDRLILAMVKPESTLEQTIQAVRDRLGHSDPTMLQGGRSLLIPVLSFDLVQSYRELCGLSLQGHNPSVSGTSIGEAVQRVKFELDEGGANLESEALIAPGIPPGKDVLFDRPFLILMMKRGSINPYFAMWVGNDELLVRKEDHE